MLRAKRVLLQSATGSGKTVIAVDFIKDWLEANPGKNVLCLFNLQCLPAQFEAAFAFHGMREQVSVFHDLLSRAQDGTRLVDHQQDTSRRIMLTMPETFAGALKGTGSKDLALDAEWVSNVGLILIDEAHKGTSENFQFIRDAIDAQVLGLTATPMRVKNKEGECLANDWEYELVTTVSIRELIEMGRLVQPLYYDLDEDAHLFREWQKAVEKHSAVDGNKQTVWFLRNTKHMKEWEAKLLEVGETCAIITSVDDEELGTSTQTPLQRQAIIRQFEEGKVTHLLSIQALCEGFDAPIAKYCVIDRGIGNKALYQQILGRVLRPYGKGNEEKINGHIIDRCGNHKTHGDIEDYIWDLEVEAADAVVIRLNEKRTVSEEQMERATKIMVKCETHGCPSVYNAKAHMSCPHCKTEHKLEIEVPAIVWLSTRFPNMPTKSFPNLLTTFKKALTGDQRAMSLILNSMDYIFGDDGDITPEFRGLYALANMNVRNEKDLKQSIRFAA